MRQGGAGRDCVSAGGCGSAGCRESSRAAAQFGERAVAVDPARPAQGWSKVAGHMVGLLVVGGSAREGRFTFRALD